jgi:MATE family, multidrug and toxin extrusion protein
MADTLGSQVYASGLDPYGLGVILQRAYMILTLFYIPIAVLFWFSEPVFMALGQEDFISEWSCKFLRTLIPGGLGYILFETTKKYFQAQGTPLYNHANTGIMQASSYVLMFTSPLNAILNYLFVYTFKFGLLGAPAATGITYWLSFLLLVLYAKYIDGGAPWGGWSRRAFRGWWIFIQLSLMGILQVGTEWLAFEIITIEAGRLGTTALAAQSVIATTDQLLNTIPFGLGVAASNRVGNLLGARKPTRSATSANVAAWTSVLFGSVIMVVMLIARSHYGKLFSVMRTAMG